MKFLGKVVAGIIVVLAWTGCQQEDINVTTDLENDGRNLEFAGPAGDITLTVSDLLEELDNEQIYIKENGLVSFRYKQEVGIDWESLVLLRDVYETWYFSPSVMPSPGLKAAHQFGFKEKVKLNPQDDVRYDSVRMEGGMLTAELSVPDGTEGDVMVTIPEVTENGEPLEFLFTASTGNTTFQFSEGLANKDVVFSQGADSSYISIQTNLDVSSVGFGDIQLDFALTNMQPGMAFGYFGQQQATKSGQQLSIEVFDELDMLKDNIEFADVEADIQAQSTIGVPFDVTVSNMQFMYDDGSAPSDLLVNNNNQVNVELPAAGYGNPVDTAETGFHISRDNSNIMDIVNAYPNQMVFEVTSYSNPEGDTGELNFMGPGNELIGDMTVTLPGWFKTDLYTRQDTVDFDVNDMLGGDEEEARKVDELIVYFDFLNKLPLGISVTARVIDSTGNELDILFDGRVVQGGVPGESGYVSEATETNFEVALSGAQIDQYLDENAKEIILQTEAETPGDDYVKLFEDMDFTADVSFEASGVAW